MHMLSYKELQDTSLNSLHSYKELQGVSLCSLHRTCGAYLGHTDGLLLHGFMDAGSVKLTNTVELICRGREAAVVK